MERLTVIFFAVVLMAGPLFAQTVSAAPPSDSSHDLSTYRGLSGALNTFQTELVILDVRSPDLFYQGHLPSAINIPVTDLWYQHPTHNLNAYIVVYGRPASADSRQGAEILRLEGYKHVILFGSITKWQGPFPKN
ncbi:MAG: rhodanese-like domain-containing protein [Spirochaetales bacterium]|nr:rhodanese-like domain-containing protein [Spirochaetales bacterium]